MDENNRNQDVRLRCIGIAMNVSQMKHQYDTQQWMRTGTPPAQGQAGIPPQGNPPAPPEMVEIFESATEIFDYVSQEQEVVSA